jgi:hypothetical protein
MPKSSSSLPGFFQDLHASPLSYRVIGSSCSLTLLCNCVRGTRFLPGLSRIPVVLPRDRELLFADAFV